MLIGYYTYAQVGEALAALHKAYPALTTVEVVGKSEEGRDIWAMTINNPKTGEKGEWTILGDKGIDNDEDGKLNEDTVGYVDANRNWGFNWAPPYVQSGSAEYPFQGTGIKAIARFLVERPNIIVVFALHNNGGMYLRGPSTTAEEPMNPRDVAVYDILGKNAEKIGNDLCRVRVRLTNGGSIPIMTHTAVQKKIHPQDLLRVSGSGIKVVSAGVVSSLFEEVTYKQYKPEVQFLQVPGNGKAEFHFLIAGKGEAVVS